MNVQMVTKSMFFDRQKVKDAVDKATRKVLAKFGAYVRTAAKSSIRKRKAISAPGQPPSSHAGHLKRLIYFGYDSGRHSVVIGPTPFRSTAEAPALLEYGGTARRAKKVIRRRRGAARAQVVKKTVTMKYRARPFMGPAFEKERPKLTAMWAGSVK